MSNKFPIIAATGSAGAGITTVRKVFEKIFDDLSLNSSYVHGNGFRKYPGGKMEQLLNEADEAGASISAFGPEMNHLDRLEGLFREFSRRGTGCIREYIENKAAAERFAQPEGTFSPWVEIPEDTNVLFYEGHHGGCVEDAWSRREMSASHNPFVIQERIKSKIVADRGVDVAQWVDLLIGIVPCINLEWMQKINQACSITQCSTQDAVDLILRRMPDYVKYITPQFSLTDINFQRIPLVDTSNPFTIEDIPEESECMVVVRFREPKKYDLISFRKKFPGSFLSRPNTLVIPNGKMLHAIRHICTPTVQGLIRKGKEV